MKFKLYLQSTPPPTHLFSSSTRALFPVSAEPHAEGWLIETDDAQAAATALKDFNYLLMEPEEYQFPQVPNFANDYTPERFKFRKPTDEEFKQGKYLPFVERMAAKDLAEKEEEAAKTDEERAAEEAEAAEIRQKLVIAGIKFHPATKIDKLRLKLAEIPPPAEEA